MTQLARRTAAVGALVVGVFLAIFFGFSNRDRNVLVCTGCQLPRQVSVARVSIPKGTSGSVIDAKGLFSTEFVRWSPKLEGAVDPVQVRGEVTIRTIAAGARLTAADFALRGPVYYPHGYPKRVPATQTPAKMSHYLGPPSFAFDLAVAPGVWVDGSPSEAAIDMHVADGMLVGYCRSVRAFEGHNPEIAFATKCWRP